MEYKIVVTSLLGFILASDFIETRRDEGGVLNLNAMAGKGWRLNSMTGSSTPGNRHVLVFAFERPLSGVELG